MTVRLARLEDTGRPELYGGRDVDMLVEHFAAGVRGPSGWDEAAVTALIRGGSPDYVLVDLRDRTGVWVQARPRRQLITVLAWLWDGRGDFFTRLMPLMFAATRAVIADFPRAAPDADNWAMEGNVPGAGATDLERETDAQRITKNIRTGSKVDVAVIEDGDHRGYKRIRARVSDLLAVEV